MKTIGYGLMVFIASLFLVPSTLKIPKETVANKQIIINDSSDIIIVTKINNIEEDKRKIRLLQERLDIN